MFQQSEVPSMKQPLFLGYFEDSHFRAGLSLVFNGISVLLDNYSRTLSKHCPFRGQCHPQDDQGEWRL